MQSLNKKAQASALITVMTILLTISLIILVALSINKIISSARFSPQISCLDMQVSQPLTMTKACVNSEDKIEVNVRRDLTVDFNEFYFVTQTRQETERYLVGPNCPLCELQGKGETKTYILEEPLLETEKITILLNDCAVQTINVREIC